MGHIIHGHMSHLTESHVTYHTKSHMAHLVSNLEAKVLSDHDVPAAAKPPVQLQLENTDNHWARSELMSVTVRPQETVKRNSNPIFLACLFSCAQVSDRIFREK